MSDGSGNDSASPERRILGPERSASYDQPMTRLETLLRILTLHCDEAARLASESLDRRLDAVRPGGGGAPSASRAGRAAGIPPADPRPPDRIAERMGEHPAPPC